jgi:hypothetical protein
LARRYEYAQNKFKFKNSQESKVLPHSLSHKNNNMLVKIVWRLPPDLAMVCARTTESIGEQHEISATVMQSSSKEGLSKLVITGGPCAAILYMWACMDLLEERHFDAADTRCTIQIRGNMSDDGADDGLPKTLLDKTVQPADIENEITLYLNQVAESVRNLVHLLLT